MKTTSFSFVEQETRPVLDQPAATHRDMAIRDAAKSEDAEPSTSARTGFADRLGLAIILIVLTTTCMLLWSRKQTRDAAHTREGNAAFGE